MAEGDTDGLDANGSIIVNGGTIDITGPSSFDYDNEAIYNGGTIIVNGVELNEIPAPMMGGHGGQFGNRPEFGERPEFGNRPEFGERPEFGARPGFEVVPEDGNIPAPDDRPNRWKNNNFSDMNGMQ